MRRFFGALFALIFYMIIFITGLVVGTGYTVIKFYSKDLPDINKLKYYQPSESTKIYSADNKLIGTIFKENRTWVSFYKIPDVMKQAILAIEDSRFYTHNGVDFIGIGRAFVADIKHEEINQGASTITMQLARNIFLTPRVTIERKIKEIILSFNIEKKFTKEDILEFYLNQIYFGSGAYGIESAASVYFDKKAKDLDLAEASMLAGLPAAPSLYSPYVNMELAKQRQKLVLDRMVQLGYVTPKQADEAFDEKLKLAKPKEEFQNLLYPYFTTYVIKELFSKYSSNQIFTGGLKVYTTLNTKLQKDAQEAVVWGVNRGINEGLNCHQGALVCLDPHNGFVRAMVGGMKFTPKSQFNRAWQALRQPGSSFKVFIYTAAIDSGKTPDTVVMDSPVSYNIGTEIWNPQNYDRRYWGPVTYRRALQFSRNVPAVRVSQEIGIGRVIEYAYKMGIKEKMDANPSIALGSEVVTVLQMASAFGVLANEGIRVEPTGIMKVIDNNGRVLEDNNYPYSKEVLSAKTAYTMVDMLKAVIQGGTGTAADIGRPAAGKTGTSNNYRDAWFIGFTPDLACGVWVGNDNFTPMYSSTGGYIPASIWSRFMKKAVAKIKPRDFAKPKEGMTLVVVCRDSRMKASAGCPHTISIYMSDEKYNALGFCRIHGGGEIKPINETPYNPNSNVKPSVTPSEIPNNEVEDLPYNDGVIKDEPADAPPATSEPPQTDAPAENIIHEEPQNTPSEEPVNEPVKNEKIQDEPGNY